MSASRRIVITPPLCQDISVTAPDARVGSPATRGIGGNLRSRGDHARLVRRSPGEAAAHVGRRRIVREMAADTPFGQLDFVYMPSRDVAADLRYFTDVLGARHVFAIDAMGT